MTREEIMAFAEAGALEAPEATAWSIEGRDSLEWAMGKLAEDVEEVRRIDAARDAAIARVNARAEELAAKVKARGAFLLGKVEEYARTHRKDLIRGKTKTASLLHGDIQYRTSPEKIEVENAEPALDWARAQPVEADMVRVKYEINKRALNEHFKQTGEIPPGCVVHPESESIIIRPEQPETLNVAPSRKEIEP